MATVKPIALEFKSGLIIGIIVVVTALLAFVTKWKQFYDYFVPNGNFMNWRFILLVIFISVFILWFIMNHLWQKEFVRHQETKNDRDNLMAALKLSENERLMDVITGIPNSRSLEQDLKDMFVHNRPGKKMQFIFIDLKNFREINNRFGFHKTNDLLRMISQSIYRRMRRNEDMYKYSLTGRSERTDKDSFYRVHSGGDEFAFIIQGDQADAIGFSNRLVGQFNELSKKATDLFNQNVKLSFYSAIVEIDPRDSLDDVFAKASECYKLAKASNKDFSLCWHPNTVEVTYANDPRKLSEYTRARELFEVLTIIDRDYS